MLAIGRAHRCAPELLRLDEPSLGLSPLMAHEVFQVVRDLNAQGVTILLVEQNVHHALSVAARAYVYDTGRITVTRDARELLDDEDLLAAYLGGQPAHPRASTVAEN
jgi:branched-chain amino acid transport system ATP-binding protein